MTVCCSITMRSGSSLGELRPRCSDSLVGILLFAVQEARIEDMDNLYGLIL